MWHDGGTAARFWSKVDATAGADSCWPWLGSVNRGGYGRFKAKGVNQNASRVAMEIETGKPLLKQQANHTCDNRKCCNPKHLYIGTQSENLKDAYARKRR